MFATSTSTSKLPSHPRILGWNVDSKCFTASRKMLAVTYVVQVLNGKSEISGTVDALDAWNIVVWTLDGLRRQSEWDREKFSLNFALSRCFHPISRTSIRICLCIRLCLTSSSKVFESMAAYVPGKGSSAENEDDAGCGAQSHRSNTEEVRHIASWCRASGIWSANSWQWKYCEMILWLVYIWELYICCLSLQRVWREQNGGEDADGSEVGESTL